MFIATIILAVLLALAYGMAGVQKLAGTPTMRKNADHLGASYGLYKVIGVLELLAAIGLLAGLVVWPLGVAAGIGLALLMAGALVYHLRARDTIKHFGPALLLGLLAVAEVIVRAASA
jgi:uncharacterized membrane protein YphA (DoxX/SURF4 family)